MCSFFSSAVRNEDLISNFQSSIPVKEASNCSIDLRIDNGVPIHYLMQKKA
jgi:hypothetical protein